MPDRPLSARIRWGNVARLAALAVVAAGVLAWPALREPPPTVPSGTPRPVVAEAPRPAPRQHAIVRAHPRPKSARPPTKQRPQTPRKWRIRSVRRAAPAPIVKVTPPAAPSAPAVRAPAPRPAPARPRPSAAQVTAAEFGVQG